MMQTAKYIVFSILISLIMALGVQDARAESDLPENATGVPIETQYFENLSNGSRKIAQALFDAQSTGENSRSWSLERIAFVKSAGDGWGRVFDEMKAIGLISDRNLGQVISRSYRKSAQASRAEEAPAFVTGAGLQSVQAYRSQRSRLPGKSRLGKPKEIVISMGSGRQVGVQLRKSNYSQRFARAQRYSPLNGVQAMGPNPKALSDGVRCGVGSGFKNTRRAGRIKVR
ncbi:MAG: hypothetical protein HQ503_08780 [Rhodospirillales bacterium]|nr:hypothetical protein [Rhodospirillales bacterium]